VYMTEDGLARARRDEDLGELEHAVERHEQRPVALARSMTNSRAEVVGEEAPRWTGGYWLVRCATAAAAAATSPRSRPRLATARSASHAMGMGLYASLYAYTGLTVGHVRRKHRKWGISISISTSLHLYSSQSPPATSTTHSTCPTKQTAQIKSMMPTLHPRITPSRVARASPRLTPSHRIAKKTNPVKTSVVASVTPN
jgi:hypothetical protein